MEIEVVAFEALANGAVVSLKGTKKGALSCVTRPNAVRVVGLFTLVIRHN